MKKQKEITEFLAIDFETANRKKTSACQLGIAFFKDGKLAWKESYLIKPFPEYYEPMNTRIHCINYEMTKDSPTFEEIWPEIEHHIKHTMLVAHNASFDISVLQRLLYFFDLEQPKLHYRCTLNLSKEKLLGFRNYQLPTLCQYFGIELKHHDAESDAVACGELMLRLLELKETLEVETYKPTSPKRQIPWSSVNLDFTTEPDSVIHGHQFEGKEVVFTGKFENLSRNELIQMVKQVGGVCKSNTLNKSTNYLIVGNQDFKGNENERDSSKIKKALELISKGHELEILDESEFFELLKDSVSFELTIDRIESDCEKLIKRNKYNDLSMKEVILSSDLDRSLYQLVGNCGGVAVNYEISNNTSFYIISTSDVVKLKNGVKSDNILKLEDSLNSGKQSSISKLKIIDEETLRSYLELIERTKQGVHKMYIYEWELPEELREEGIIVDN